MHLICNDVISIIVLSIIYIDFTIVKSLHGVFRPKVVHCNFRGCNWCIATSFGAFMLRGIQALGHFYADLCLSKTEQNSS